MKTVLILSPGGLDKQDYDAILKLKSEGVESIYLGNGTYLPENGFFKEALSLPLNNIRETISNLKKLNLNLDGVAQLCFEAITPLVAKIAEEFALIGNTTATAFKCRNKFLMRETLNAAGLPYVKTFRCRDFTDLKAAISELGDACVAKPIAAHSSYGAFYIPKAPNLKEIQKKYDTSIEYIKNVLSKSQDLFPLTEADLTFIGIQESPTFQTDYVVEEFVPGMEISVDSIVQGAKVNVAGIAEQTRMEAPYFIQLAERMPFEAPIKVLEEIEELNAATIQAIGITDSCTHCEIFLSPTGAKVCEIACRMGGDNISDSVLQAHGINLAYEAVMISLGVNTNISRKPISHTAMKYLLPEREGVLQKIVIPDELRLNKQITEIYTPHKPGTFFAPPPKGFDYVCYVSAKGGSSLEADLNVDKAIKKLEIIYED